MNALLLLVMTIASPTETERDEAQLLLEQAIDHGATWRQGLVEIKVEIRHPNRAVHRQLLAFDHEAGLTRFDVESESPGDSQWYGKYIATPQEVLLASGDSREPGHVSRYVPGEEADIRDAKPFELQAIAIADATAVVNHLDLALLQNHLMARCRPDTLVALDRHGTKITATWEAAVAKQGARDARTTFTFDLDASGLPVRSTTELRNPSSGEWELWSVTTREWKRIGETYVPTILKSYDGFDRNQPKDMAEMTLDWKSVNKLLPGEMFTMEGMALNPKALVVNEKLGAPVIEGSVREILSPPNDAKGFEVAGRGRFWLIVVNSVLLIAIVVSLLLWRRRRQTKGVGTGPW